MVRQFSSTAQAATLTAGVSPSDTTLPVSTTTGFPGSFPYTLSIDADNASKELVDVTAAVGLNLTVTRGVDGTSAVSHSLGAAVRHDHSARDFREAVEHAAAGSDVHGVSGDLVGATSVQVLTNKDLSDPSNTLPDNLVTLTGAQTLEDKTIDLTDNTVTGTLAEFNTAVSDANLASLAGAETLTSKTIALGSNSVSGTKAEFNAALSDGDFATIAGTETLTGKTLTAPTITDPTITGGADIAGGLTVDAITLDGVPLGVYQAYTPTVVGVDATVELAKWCRVGPEHNVGTVVLTFTDAPTGEVSVTLPTDMEVPLGFNLPVVVGSAAILDADQNDLYTLAPAVFDGFGDNVVYFAWADSIGPHYMSAGQGWAADDILTIQFSYPAAA